ncbi:MFS transporter [Paenibacillus marinisediminis]
MILIHNRAFRHLFIGRILSVFADSILFFALLKWIELNSAHSESFTLFYAAYYLPIAMLALPIGAWISNKTLQRVMSHSNTIRSIVLVAFVCVMPYIPYQWTYVILIIESVIGLFFIPANQSLLPHIVQDRQRPTANSLLQLGFTVVKILGQTFTALMIKLSFTPTSLLLVSVGLLIFSLVFINRIKPLVKNESAQHSSQWSLMKEGVRYIIKHPQLKSLFSFLAVAMFVATSIDLLLIAFLTEVLSEGVENLGFIGAASMLGMMLGALLVPRWYNRIERKWLIIPPLFALCLSLGSLCFITNWVMIPPLFFIQGIALGCFNVTFVSYLQEAVASEQYTRTFSIYHMIMSSAALPGILIVSALLSNMGVITTIAIIAVILLIIGILGMYLIPGLGKAETQKTAEAQSQAQTQAQAQAT